jgi:mannose-6-phosphate isomerase
MESPKPFREERPWGEFIEFTRNKPSTVKIIKVKPNEALSLQSHKERDEFWHIVSGTGIATKGMHAMDAGPGDEFFIPRLTNHRLEAREEPLVVLEIALGDAEETDINRVEDKYGRESAPDNP